MTVIPSTAIDTAKSRKEAAAAVSRELARQDIREAFASAGHHVALAWWDVRMRYQRTLLGPLWITMSTAVFVVSLGILYSQIFNTQIDQYLPYLAAGFMVWNLMAMTVIEAPGVFVSMGSVIKSLRVPYVSHIVRQIARNTITFLHTLIVIFFVELYVGMQPNWLMLLTVPGLLLLLVNVFWMSLAMAILGARYRDINHVVASILQLMFFLTPIIWQRSIIGLDESSIWVEGNIFYHLVNIVRAPMLGQAPALMSYAVAAAAAVAGSIATYFLFLKYRRRIAYWV